MARMTRKLVKHISATTDVCYMKALGEEYPHVFREAISTFTHYHVSDMKDALVELDLPIRSESINNRYLDHLVKLDTYMLELIVEADRKGKFRRSPFTIDAILGELLHRASVSETKEPNDGEGKTRRRSRSKHPVG